MENPPDAEVVDQELIDQAVHLALEEHSVALRSRREDTVRLRVLGLLVRELQGAYAAGKDADVTLGVVCEAIETLAREPGQR